MDKGMKARMILHPIATRIKLGFMQENLRQEFKETK